MTPGAALLKARETFGHGLGTAWCREVLRPRILHTAPVQGTTDRAAEIHVLTSGRDWLNLVWTLKSFYAVSPRRLALCIHEDGSLGPEAIARLREHFPDARLIVRAEADARMEAALAAHPACLALRRENLLAPKLFDFAAFLEGERIALFDSDLLFFAPPRAWLDHLEDPAGIDIFNEDIASAYALDEAALHGAGHPVLPRINSGFGLVRPGTLAPDRIEEFLAIPGLAAGHFWRIEQTLFALCATRAGAELLPAEYRVFLGSGIGGRPMRHYVGAIRHLMYGEGMRHLARRMLQ